MPSALRSERRAAIKALEPFPVVVKTLPALEEIASGHVEVSDLRPIEVEDLLGRDPVAPERRASHRACEGQGGDDHRRRRLDRLGADPPAARAWTEDARPVRAVGGRALRDRDGDRGEQMAPREGARGNAARRHQDHPGARLGARPQARGPHHRQIRRRGHLSRSRLQACADRGDEPVHRRCRTTPSAR